jgi:hypothetical protein
MPVPNQIVTTIANSNQNNFKGLAFKMPAVEGHGVFAHMTKCFYYGELILNVLKKLKTRQKMLSVHLNIECSPTKVLGRETSIWPM